MKLSPRTPYYLAAIALLAGVGAAFVTEPLRAVTIAANIFFSLYLLASCATFPQQSGEELRSLAAKEDIPALGIFFVTVATVTAAMLALFALLNDPAHTGIQFGLALASVPLGWATIHMIAAKHYAHLFWQSGDNKGSVRGGLEFPGTEKPGGWEFVYFSFVIGMTAQTSDVQITGAHIRRFNVGHAMVSFLFNTVLVAAAVNVAVALGN